MLGGIDKTHKLGAFVARVQQYQPFVDKDKKNDYAGAKQMKDKARITLMVCTAADGTKVPLAIVGKSKNPKCFAHLPGKEPPMHYTSQKRAWFTKHEIGRAHV